MHPVNGQAKVEPLLVPIIALPEAAVRVTEHRVLALRGINVRREQEAVQQILVLRGRFPAPVKVLVQLASQVIGHQIMRLVVVQLVLLVMLVQMVICKLVQQERSLVALKAVVSHVILQHLILILEFLHVSLVLREHLILIKELPAVNHVLAEPMHQAMLHIIVLLVQPVTLHQILDQLLVHIAVLLIVYRMIQQLVIVHIARVHISQAAVNVLIHKVLVADKP